MCFPLFTLFQFFFMNYIHWLYSFFLFHQTNLHDNNSVFAEVPPPLKPSDGISPYCVHLFHFYATSWQLWRFYFLHHIKNSSQSYSHLIYFEKVYCYILLCLQFLIICSILRQRDIKHQLWNILITSILHLDEFCFSTNPPFGDDSRVSQTINHTCKNLLKVNLKNISNNINLIYIY